MDIGERARCAQIELDERQEQQLDLMIKFLLEYNEKVNLTAICEREAVIEKHLIDSILPLTMAEIPSGASCCDIGTGAGFPAVPMMIYRPDLRFTLVDSLKKRTVYLTELSERLGIRPQILHARAEEAKLGARFEMVTARAVASLPVLLELCLPLLKIGGKFLAMRGSSDEPEEHVREVAKLLGGAVEQDFHYELPSGDGRRLIVFEKKSPSPKQFPRASAVMKKRPL